MAKRDLSGARAIVTGASSGIGRELARRLVQSGSHVLATARRADRLESLSGELSSAAGRLEILIGDITCGRLRQQLVATAIESFGGLDLLVNNAGLGGIGRFDEATEERLRQIMEVNFFAPLELIRVALPSLKQGTKPLIANVGSVLGHRAVPLKSEYCASKFALHGFSDALRAELVGCGVDVMLASPSTTSSEFFDQVVETNSDLKGLKRSAASPERVARQIVSAIRRGRQEVILSASGKALVWFDRLFPSWANRVVAKHQ